MKPGTYLICFCRWFVIQDFRQSEILEAPEHNSITEQSTLRTKSGVMEPNIFRIQFSIKNKKFMML